MASSSPPVCRRTTTARNGHTIVLPFSVEADVPIEWECRCGERALLRDADVPEAKAGQARAHPLGHAAGAAHRGELQELLDERLDLLRAGKLRRSA